MGKSILKFKELNETSLTFGEIVRAARSFRADLFIKKMKLGEPFEMTDGSTAIIKYDAGIESAIRKGSAKGL